jgi:Zn-dependent protease with chaperone function
MLKLYRLILGASLVLTVPTAVLAQKPKTLKPGFNLFSTAQDVQLGKEAAAQIEKQVAVIDHRDLNEYVNRIGKKLSAQPEAGQFPYTFKVVYDKSINAFALPGGPAYVHTGLISSADNEAQLAGVLAHEIAHVSLRHGTSQATKAQALQLVAGLGVSLLGGGSMLGQLAQMGVGLGANSLLLKFSRSAESDADLLGARMMAKAGYDPIEMARFFEKLEAGERASGQSVAQFFSDHPSPGNRVKAVSAEVKMMPATQYTKGNTADLQRIQGTVKALPVPPKANTDFRSSGNPEAARPANELKQFRNQLVTLQHPGNWEVFSNNQSNEITIASREGIIEASGNAEIGYGAVVGLTQSKNAIDLDRDSKAFLDQLMKSNRNMQASGQQPKRFQVSGSPALLHVVYSGSPYKNQKEVDAIVTAVHPQGLFYMILISPESEYSKAQSSFDRMIQSVQFGR